MEPSWVIFWYEMLLTQKKDRGIRNGLHVYVVHVHFNTILLNIELICASIQITQRNFKKYCQYEKEKETKNGEKRKKMHK